MTQCNRPGCVAAALAGRETCFVHGAKMGRVCEFCRGTGVVRLTRQYVRRSP
jgi:hypothetical protein